MYTGDGWEVGAYDGTYLAGTRDVVIVTLNYRLGAFGFLVGPGTSDRANYALEDQRLALQWVAAHISAFGGDPQAVTLFGESAGAISVAAHMASPPSAGLFQRAILESDPFTLITKTRADAQLVGARVAANANCTYDLACLRTLTMREVVAASNVGAVGKDSILGDLLTWGPTIDAYNQPRAALAAFQDAAAYVADVPMIVGTNSDEITLFQDLIDVVLRVVSALTGRDLAIELTETVYRTLLTAIFRTKAPAVLRAYPPLPNNASNYDQFVQLVTHYTFECSTRQARTVAPRRTQWQRHSHSHKGNRMYVRIFKKAHRHAD
jgi:carboxylesterase type B